MPAPTISRRALRQRCKDLESSALNRGVASHQELDDFRPGGAKNSDRTVWGWLYYHARLHAWMERQHVETGRSLRPDQREGAAPSSRSAARSLLESDDEAFLSALSGEGRRVPLLTAIATDTELVQAVTVYPKSRAALLEIHLLDEDIAWLGRRLQWLSTANAAGRATAGELAMIAPTARRIVALQRRIVWILTTPGAWCPYEPDAVDEPPAPDWLHALDEFDFSRILLAHRDVNEFRIAHLAAYLPTDAGRDGAGVPTARWSTFVAATAYELGEDPEHLNKRWSLTKAVAAAALAAKARHDAYAAAEAAAKQKAHAASAA